MTLEQRLAAMASDAFPAAPDLTAAVAVRLRTADALPARARRRWPRAWVVVAALLVPAAAIAAVAALPGVRIVRVRQLPALPAPTQADLGPVVPSVAAATRRAGFPVQVVAALGAPAVIHTAVGGIVTLVYPEVIVTELRARDELEILTKRLGPDTAVKRADVDGAPGIFLSGAPHEVSYLAPTGRFGSIPPRLAGTTLAFLRDGLVIRIEGASLSLRRALVLARTIRP